MSNMENICIKCKVKPIYVKKRKLCLKCYGQVRHIEYKERVGRKILYHSEVEFIKNYFTHNNWVYQPAIFRLNGVNYEPDFYDGERNVFIEVSGTKQAFQANFDKYKLFIKTYPLIKFEIRDIYGELKSLTKRPYVKQQDSAKNNP